MAAVYCFSNFVQEYEQVCQAGAPFSESVLTSFYKSLTVCIFHNVIPHQGLKNLPHLTCKADWPVVAGFIRPPFLKIGLTLAVFQSLGTTPSSSDLSNIILSGFQITSSSSKSSLGCRSSVPAALSGRNFRSLPLIFSSLTSILGSFSFISRFFVFGSDWSSFVNRDTK